MAQKALSGPQLEPISLAEAKAHLRIDHDDEDPRIAELIRGGREYVETRSRRHVVAGNYQLTLDAWPASGPIELQGPVLSVDTVQYYAPVYGYSLWPQANNWQTDILSEPARLLPLPGVEWPEIEDGILQAVSIGYTAGWVKPADVPAVIRAAVLKYVAHGYAHRGEDPAAGMDAAGSALDRLIWSARR